MAEEADTWKAILHFGWLDDEDGDCECEVGGNEEALEEAQDDGGWGKERDPSMRRTKDLPSVVSITSTLVLGEGLTVMLTEGGGEQLSAMGGVRTGKSSKQSTICGEKQ